MSIRVGIDVGGTNTDAVLMDDLKVLSLRKTPTTADVSSGIVAALEAVPPSAAPTKVSVVYPTGPESSRLRLPPVQSPE